MSFNSQGKYEWMEYLRLITPVLIFVVGAYVASIDRKIDDMSKQIFHHLTNDEIHMPRTIAITKAEFQIYQVMRDSQMKDLRDSLKELSDLVKMHIQTDEKYFYGQ
jgi:hypothetical protein